MYYFRTMRALAPQDLPVQLTGRVGVGVHDEGAAGLQRQAQQPLGRVEPLRPAVDLHRHVEHRAGGEDRDAEGNRKEIAQPGEVHDADVDHG